MKVAHRCFLPMHVLINLPSTVRNYKRTSNVMFSFPLTGLLLIFLVSFQVFLDYVKEKAGLKDKKYTLYDIAEAVPGAVFCEVSSQ